MKAWLFQRNKGKGKSWSVQWRELDGKLREKQIGKKRYADDFRKQKEDELASASTGYVERSWSDFRQEYEDKILAGLAAATGVIYRRALDHFETHCGPKLVGNITTKTIDGYIAARRKERGRNPDSQTSPATINNELRTLKRVLNVACRWKYLREQPSIEFVKEPKLNPTFVSSEEFTTIYAACSVATYPTGVHYTPAAWWRAFLLFQYMTGWRMSEPLELLREDLDLETGYAVTRAKDNKAGKEARIPLHPVVVEHLKAIPGFTPEVFPWPQGRRTMWEQFKRIQKQAGIKKTCRKDHPCMDSCNYYGFHDLRRGFATQNADKLSASQLQQMMRHSSYVTTQKYINMAAQLNTVTDRLSVPTLDNTLRQQDSRA